MGISAYKEMTEWVSEFPVPNHIYLFDGKSNILAYEKASNGEIVVLEKPLKMDTRRRKFIKVKNKKLDNLAKTFKLKEEPELLNVPTWQVQSDSGKTYTVQLIGKKYSCNCVGYGYRGKCKHSEAVKNEQS